MDASDASNLADYFTGVRDEFLGPPDLRGPHRPKVVSGADRSTRRGPTLSGGVAFERTGNALAMGDGVRAYGLASSFQKQNKRLGPHAGNKGSPEGGDRVGLRMRHDMLDASVVSPVGAH